MLLTYNQLTQLNKKENNKRFAKDQKFTLASLEYLTFLGECLNLSMP
jgi:hypothetical protein